jgi:predicted transposase YbfD/YdcC
LALKNNQGTLEKYAALLFSNPGLTKDCPAHEEIDSGHGRIEERTVRAADAAWLAERHPEWRGLQSVLALTTWRTIKKTGAVHTETRLYISFLALAPDPVRLAAAVRVHWSVENNLHWVLDVAFRKDECRMRKYHSAPNLAMTRRAVLNLLRREPSKLSLKRKRLKAAINPAFRAAVLAR